MFKIVKDNAKSIHAICKPVSLPVSKEDQETLFEMLQYLKDSQDEEFRKKNPKVREGVGLAAPQIGLNKQMLVVYYKQDDKEVKHLLINPKIIVSSVRKAYLANGEGCLSVDKEHPGYVIRDYRIVVRAIDGESLQEVDVKAFGYEAIVLQHEIDHLKGVLFYDHIDPKNPYAHPDNAVEI